MMKEVKEEEEGDLMEGISSKEVSSLDEMKEKRICPSWKEIVGIVRITKHKLVHCIMLTMKIVYRSDGRIDLI